VKNPNLVEAMKHLDAAKKKLQALPPSRSVAVAITQLEIAQLCAMRCAMEEEAAKPVAPSDQPHTEIEIQDPCTIPPISEYPWWVRAFFGCP
jgi:hypothetical protein